MRSVIESEMPLIVAIQHSKSGMFSKFHFTCFEWIIQGKLFHTPPFNLKNLCAAGTEEGPILLISKLTQSIVPVCLLCVHKRKVSDIAMSHQINTFLSVSIDGSVAGWHCSDGSCCFVYDNLLPPGEIKIVLCDSNASFAWFWTRGESASLVDLKRGTVVQKIDFVGLSSFAILKKHSNFLSNPNHQQSSQSSSHTNQPSFAIMAGINRLRTYQIDEKTNFFKCKKVDEILFSLGQKYFLTSNGIITVKDKLLKIFLPNIEIPIYTENITEMSDDDIISTASWKHPETLIISSFKGFFKIYKMQILKNDSSQRISIQKVKTFSCPDCCIFSNIAINFDIGFVIFAATSFPKKHKKTKKSSANQSTVMCLSINDQKIVKLVIPQIDKICCIPDPKSRIVIQAEQRSSTFQIFDWGSSTSIVQANSNDIQNDNISIKSNEYNSSISRSFVGSNLVTVNQSLKPIPSSSEVRNYSLFGKQLPFSQSVDFRPNISSSFFLREGSLGTTLKASYITSIACQNFNNLASRLQIIVGTSDGKLYFFWENNHFPFEISEALISPIISIVLLPMRFTKASCLIAIGKDGSFCLFKWNKMSHRYVTNYLPIVSIGVIESQRLIVVQKSDNSFSIYNLKSPEPIAVMLIPPPRTVFIWSKVNFSKPAGIQSTMSMEIAGSSLFYSVLEVSKLRKSKLMRKNQRIPIPKSGKVDMSPLISQQEDKKESLLQKISAKMQSAKDYAKTKDNFDSNTGKLTESNEKVKESSNYKSSVNSNSSNSDSNQNKLHDSDAKTNESMNSKNSVSSNLTSHDSNQNKTDALNTKIEENTNSKSTVNSNLPNSESNSNKNITKSNAKANTDSKISNVNNLTVPNSTAIENSHSNTMHTNPSSPPMTDANSCIFPDPNSANSIESTTHHSASNPNVSDKKITNITGSKPNTVTKSGSNSNIYSEYSGLVKKVNTDSNSDSNPNSDSGNEFYSTGNQTSEIPSISVFSESIISNEHENDKENDSSNTDLYLNDLLPLRDTAMSSNFEDSLVNLSFRGVDQDEKDSKIIEDNKNNKEENGNIYNGPISRSGRFTATGIKNMVSVILEMMVPTSATDINVDAFKTKSANFQSGLIENSKRFNSIDKSQDALSFVLVGHKNRPTFFYPMFKLSGPTVFDTSPFNAAIHYLSYKIMSNFLNLIRNTEKFEKENKFKICGFISILTQLLFVNDLEIQRISALTCNKIVNWSSSGIVVPEHVWNLLVASYIQYFDKNDVADYDKFLMAIMMVTHADLVDPIYHNIVFDFLKKNAQERCPSNFLAFNILLANFDFWAAFLFDDKSADDNDNNNSKVNKKGKKELMIFLMNTFFIYEDEEKKLVKEKLCNIIKENFNSFCESIRFILINHPNQNIASKTCEICFELIEEHPRSIGSLAPLFIAYLADAFNQLQEVFYSNLKRMQSKFKREIVNLDQIWLIATNDGFIHVFKNMKFFFKEKISDGPILLVSIGPNAAFAAAITENDQSMVKIDLKSSFFLSLSKKRIVEKNKINIKSGLPFENLKIVWDNKDSCHIEYY